MAGTMPSSSPASATTIGSRTTTVCASGSIAKASTAPTFRPAGTCTGCSDERRDCQQNACTLDCQHSARGDSGMANLTIRNVDDDIVETLKARAKAHNRSLEAEIRQILADQVRRPWRGGAELRALAEKIAAMTPNVPQTDSVELLREDRDR